ncbi:type I-B CRISPR-associated protein Cas5b [Fusobacterium necrophorum]|uniref:type I-B CRISPR-associated protein Cas5b n=1 Tax=Fusobacterium necrophorum TaxID=859 RepID=UPI00254F1177|nr:type I-B CRISPR-associated protein Cas5b [Fusobacterium necrophorum]MDK4501364.1 type I-B CRISPR-associated protein Cas5b [Fusobacterium necrophorum]MDK4521261.1 type I-B CRISPR-associated protein Cas5b [Fusobacterium necrophorum]
MKALKFQLSGEHAFFKDNAINTVYLTYGQIHRVALLGIFGAILGYGGYSQQYNILHKKKDTILKYPEFYERLKDLKLAVVPKAKTGIFDKKMQVFNNGVGYASQEQGGNLIIKEFWLEKPAWDIYVLLDSEESQKIKDYIINKKAIFLPYLGKNEHFADITDIELVSLVETIEKENIISSMIKMEDATVKTNFQNYLKAGKVREYKYCEYLPTELTKETNQYILEKFMFTNMPLVDIKKTIYMLETLKEEIKLIFY